MKKPGLRQEGAATSTRSTGGPQTLKGSSMVQAMRSWALALPLIIANAAFASGAVTLTLTDNMKLPKAYAGNVVSDLQYLCLLCALILQTI